MGLTKSDKFTAEQNRLAEMAKALGHPARVAILQYLATRKNCVCGSIVDEIGLAQSTVSQHLKELKKAELIQGSIEGVTTCYCINADVITLLNSQLSKMLSSCCSAPDCC